jgi:mono/diheme cytochrome c family protein
MWIRCLLLLPLLVLFAATPRAAGTPEARREFVELCSGCHGEDARGNGPDSKNLSKPAPDLTEISRRAGGIFDDKAVYDWIVGLNASDAHGTRDMPIWGDWLMDEEMEDATSLDAARAAERKVDARVKALVAYLKSIQRKD